jgi:hypothetical protein
MDSSGQTKAHILLSLKAYPFNQDLYFLPN